MCGRYNLVTDAQALVDFFDVAMVIDPVFVPRYNIAPTQFVPIICDQGRGRDLLNARWGLVPHWSREGATKYSTINARAETVAVKPTYRDSFRNRRCLVPATGFYEGLHERMPVILEPKDYSSWLTGGRDVVNTMLRPHGQALEIRPVSRYVNSPAHDDPRCLDPF